MAARCGAGGEYCGSGLSGDGVEADEEGLRGIADSGEQRAGREEVAPVRRVRISVSSVGMDLAMVPRLRSGKKRRCSARDDRKSKQLAPLRRAGLKD